MRTRIQEHTHYRLHCGQPMARGTSLSMIIGDARAFRRLAPPVFTEASTHALVAHDASDKVAVAVRQAYLHRLPRILLPCFVGNWHTDTSLCRGRALCCRWG